MVPATTLSWDQTKNLERRLIVRILHILHQYLPDYVGGTELYTQVLARYQVEQGDSVTIFVPAIAGNDWPEPALEDGVHVYRFSTGRREPRRIFLDLFGQSAIDQAFDAVLSREMPELVHIQHLMGLPVSIVRQLVRVGIPYVVTLHDYWYPCANAQLLTNYDQTICSGPQWGLNCGRCAIVRSGKPNAQLLAPAIAPIMAYRNSQTAFVLKNAEALIAPTDFVRQTYASFGTPWEKIHVIPHGIRLPDMMPPKFEREDDILDVIYVGGISWQKGLHILVQAFNQLPAEHFRLTIYGDESTFPDYSARLRRLSRQSEIRFAGRLPHQELWKALSLSDVLVVPSLWYETASLIIQEAFAARVPVVASDIGALKERIVHEENGLSIPPGDIEALRDILLQLQSEPGRLAALGANIRPVRSVVEHAQDVSQLYQTILLPTTP